MLSSCFNFKLCKCSKFCNYHDFDDFDDDGSSCVVGEAGSDVKAGANIEKPMKSQRQIKPQANVGTTTRTPARTSDGARFDQMPVGERRV